MMADEATPENKDATPANDAAPETAPAGLAEPAANEALQAEAADLKNKLLRTLAEMENLRRRTEREISDARQYAVANFARDMLTVGDNLRRAIDAVPKEQRGSGDAALDALIDGVEVTERGLEQSLTKFGVKRIETKGTKFDPAIHQAMFEIESADAQPGTVVEEIQAGYIIGERTLRPALVGIAKKPKAAPVAEETSETTVAKAAEGPES
jgi:molecular chaperone GrpE